MMSIFCFLKLFCLQSADPAFGSLFVPLLQQSHILFLVDSSGLFSQYKEENSICAVFIL